MPRADRPSGPPGSLAAYRRESGRTLIELELGDLRELVDSFDPAPFGRKDLDARAAEWIVGAAEEQPRDEPLGLLVWLPAPDPAAAEAPGLVAHYFAYRATVERRRLAQLFRAGRLALLVGAGFMIACYAAAAAIDRVAGDSALAWVGEGLIIFAWVALWRPGEIFLYDWWPLLRAARLYERLAAMPVDVRVRS